MKAKELKALRKKIEKADRLEDPLEDLVGNQYHQYSLLKSSNGYRLEKAPLSAPLVDGEPKSMDTDTSNTTSMESPSLFKLSYYKSWKDITPSHLFSDIMSLFEENMGDSYQQSSWGLNLEEKKEEFQHRKAHFLVLTRQPQGDEESSKPQLMAFCHVRWEYDDDQYPTCAALYLYEIQIQQAFQSQGLGQCLMALVYKLAQQSEMSKILLTVFKSNQRAMTFYTQKLDYVIDETSPSQHKERADFEILSKVVVANGEETKENK